MTPETLAATTQERLLHVRVPGQVAALDRVAAGIHLIAVALIRSAISVLLLRGTGEGASG